MQVQMQLRRLEQSYDFETGETKNILVMAFGGAEIRVPVDEAQVEQIVRAARSQPRWQVVPHQPTTVVAYAKPVDAPVTTSVATPQPGEQSTPTEDKDFATFVAGDDAGYEGDDDTILFGGDYDASGEAAIETPGVDEGLAPITPSASVAIPHRSSAQPEAAPREPPKTSTQLRKETIAAQSVPTPGTMRAQRIKELRARAAAVAPQRRLSDSQVDEAGNPVVAKHAAPSRLAPAQPGGAVIRNIPKASIGADEDGFPSG